MFFADADMSSQPGVFCQTLDEWQFELRTGYYIIKGFEALRRKALQMLDNALP